jgi:hypothetical protein
LSEETEVVPEEVTPEEGSSAAGKTTAIAPPSATQRESDRAQRPGFRTNANVRSKAQKKKRKKKKR